MGWENFEKLFFFLCTDEIGQLCKIIINEQLYTCMPTLGKNSCMQIVTNKSLIF